MNHLSRPVLALLVLGSLLPGRSARAAPTALTFSRSILSAGQMVTATLTVSNTGGVLTGAVPDIGAFIGAGLVDLASGPVPSSTALLPAGGTAVFVWTFSTSGSGPAWFSGTLTGWDAGLGDYVSISATGMIVVQRPPGLSAALTVAPPSVSPGDAVMVVYTVSNSGEAGAMVTPLPPKVSGSGTGYLALASSTVFLPGGGQAAFTWVYTAGPNAGTISFTASGSGTDANSGAWVPSPQAAAGPVSIVVPSVPCPASPTRLTWYDGPSTGNDQGHAIEVDSSGSIFVAGEEDREDISHQADCIVIGYPPGGGGLFYMNNYASAGSVPDVAYGIARGADGSIYSAGRAGDAAWVAKFLDPGGSDWTLLPAAPPGGPDEARAVAVDPAGNLIVAGKQRRTDLGHGDDVWVAKYTPAGGLVWSVNYNGPASTDDAAFAVAVDPAGNSYVAGHETRTDLGQGRNILLLKYDAGGALLMTRTSTGPGSGNDEGRAVALDGAGNIYVAGFETRPDLGQGENGWVRKYTAAGVPVWTATFNSPMTRAGGPNDRALGIVVDPANGDVFVTGREEWPGQGSNILFARWDASGVLLEMQSHDDVKNRDDEGHAITIGPGGDLYVAGFEEWNNWSTKQDIVVYRWARPGCLDAALSVSPVPVVTGSPIEVVLSVTNTGVNAMTGVTPVLSIDQGAALLAPLTSPSAVASLPAGTAAYFTWTFATSGAGPVGLTGTATGVESGSGMTMAAWDSAGTIVLGTASLAGAISLPATACPTVPFTLTVTVTNTGLGSGWIGSATVLETGAAVALLGGPLPPLPLTVAAGAAVTLAWTWSTAGVGTDTFSVTVTGADLTTGNPLVVGPLAADLMAGAPPVLVGQASVTPVVPVGGVITVALTVSNTGVDPATGVVPAPAVSPPGAPVAPLTGPSPPGPVVIGAGASQTFIWTYSATGTWRSVAFTLTVAGSNACGPVSVSATATSFLGTPAALVGSVVSIGPSSVCTGGQITVIVSVTNTGQWPAESVSPGLLARAGAASVALVAAPAATSLWGGQAAHFTWTYSAMAAGTVWLTATVSGIEASSGATIWTTPLVSPPVTVTTAAVLGAAAAIPASAIAGTWITATVWVSNTGGEDAVNVTATGSAGPGGTWISGPIPAGPVTIPAGPPQPFVWTWSLSGSGPVVFSFTVAGTTCGGLPVRGTAAGTTTVLRRAGLVVDSFVLAPAGAVAGAAVTATLVLRNSGDAPLTVVSISRTVTGGGGLGAPGAFAPAVPWVLAGGAAQAVTWIHVTSTPCGTALETVGTAGFENGTGRTLWSGAVTSNQVSITGTPTGLSLSAATDRATVGTPVVLTAVVTDACGAPVPGATVTFTVSAGGGWLSTPSVSTDAAGRAAVTLTLGLDEGRNMVLVSVGGTPLAAYVAVDAVNPLVLDTPGAALDRNVLYLGTGEVVLVRIYPTNDDPIITRVFTASGHLVRTLRHLNPSGRGQFLVTWNGLTEDEFAVARGVYLIDVRGGGIKALLKVVVK